MTGICDIAIIVFPHAWDIISISTKSVYTVQDLGNISGPLMQKHVASFKHPFTIGSLYTLTGFVL